MSINGVRNRLNVFADNPEKNARHVVKALLVFALLDKQFMRLSELPGYLAGVPILHELNAQFLHLTHDELATRVVNELTAAGAISIADGAMRATMRA